MKILSLDTSMAACSAAVVDTGRDAPLAEAFAAMDRGHAEALAPMVADVVKASGLSIDEIDRIAVTTGPGTFTGVRIGLAFARGLGLARAIPVIGIDSLTAIAANDGSPSPLLVVADARNEEVYAALYDAARSILRGPHVTSVAEAARGLPAGTRVAGSAAAAVRAARDAGDLQLSQANPLPVAARFAALAAESVPGDMPSPLYLRAPDAKPQTAPLRNFSELTIIPAESSSASLLASLHAESFEESWTETAFAGLLAMPGAAADLALADGEPVAFIVTRMALDEAEIITIGTRPAVQRRGAARQLLDSHLGKLARNGITHVFLDVAASNTAAQRLYAAQGFREAGRRKGYYKRGGGAEDAVLMRKDLIR